MMASRRLKRFPGGSSSTFSVQLTWISKIRQANTRNVSSYSNRSDRVNGEVSISFLIEDHYRLLIPFRLQRELKWILHAPSRDQALHLPGKEPMPRRQYIGFLDPRPAIPFNLLADDHQLPFRTCAIVRFRILASPRLLEQERSDLFPGGNLRYAGQPISHSCDSAPTPAIFSYTHNSTPQNIGMLMNPLLHTVHHRLSPPLFIHT
jgi:hypothetical protein